MNQELLNYLEGFVTEKRKNLFKKVLEQRTRHFSIVLENIYQPHNSSAVVRSCDIFGVQDVHVIENTYSSKVSRHVARGSQKWLTFHRYSKDLNNTEECFDNLRSQGYQIIATTPHNDSCYLDDFDISKKSAFVFGVEKEGVSDYVKENADGFLKIPMVGFTESLNISVSAAIILQDVVGRMRRSSVQWQLSEEEKTALEMEWTKRTIKSVDQIIERYYQSKNS